LIFWTNKPINMTTESHNIHAEIDAARAGGTAPALSAHNEVQKEIRETVGLTPAALPGATLTTSAPVAGTTTTSFFEGAFAILRKNPLFPKASALFHWQDPTRTGAVFGSLTLVYLLVNFFEYSFLTVFGYAAATLTLACIVYANFVILRAQYGQGKTVENPFKELFNQRNFQLSKADAEPHFDTVLELTNLAAARLREIFFVTNNVLSLQSLALFYFAAVFGKFFGDFTVVYLAFLGLFVWPRLYQEKHNEIDALYAKAQTEANKYQQLALSKVPPALQQKFAFLKPHSA